MKRFLLSTLLFSAMAVFAEGGEPKATLSKIEQEEGEINQTDENGRKQGPWIVFGKDKPDAGYPAEGKVEEGPYKDDRKDGQWIKYHKDGITPRLIGEYVNGRPNGPYKKIYENGQVKEEGIFTKGKQVGTKKMYYEDGTVAQEKTFNEEGKEEGVQRYFYPNGQVEFEYTKKNGVNSGTAVRYTESGEVKETITYGADGEVASKEVKEVKEPETPKVESGSGGPSGTSGDTKGKTFQKDGYNKVYNSNDELWMDGKFKSGKLWDGKLYKYDSDGILLKIEIWKNGKYHSDGQLN